MAGSLGRAAQRFDSLSGVRDNLLQISSQIKRKKLIKDLISMNQQIQQSGQDPESLFQNPMPEVDPTNRRIGQPGMQQVDNDIQKNFQPFDPNKANSDVDSLIMEAMGSGAFKSGELNTFNELFRNSIKRKTGKDQEIDQFTLSQGQRRYDEKGNLIADYPKKQGSDTKTNLHLGGYSPSGVRKSLGIDNKDDKEKIHDYSTELSALDEGIRMMGNLHKTPFVEYQPGGNKEDGYTTDPRFDALEDTEFMQLDEEGSPILDKNGNPKLNYGGAYEYTSKIGEKPMYFLNDEKLNKYKEEQKRPYVKMANKIVKEYSAKNPDRNLNTLVEILRMGKNQGLEPEEALNKVIAANDLNSAEEEILRKYWIITNL